MLSCLGGSSLSYVPVSCWQLPSSWPCCKKQPFLMTSLITLINMGNIFCSGWHTMQESDFLPLSFPIIAKVQIQGLPGSLPTQLTGYPSADCIKWLWLLSLHWFNATAVVSKTTNYLETRVI